MNIPVEKKADLCEHVFRPAPPTRDGEEWRICSKCNYCEPVAKVAFTSKQKDIRELMGSTGSSEVGYAYVPHATLEAWAVEHDRLRQALALKAAYGQDAVSAAPAQAEGAAGPEGLYFDLIRLAWACEPCTGLGHVFRSDGCWACKTCESLRALIHQHFRPRSGMDLETSVGSRVIFRNGLNGQDGDIRSARRHLTLGAAYTVKRINVYDCSSTVYLQEFPEFAFNSVQFENLPEPQQSETSGVVEIGGTFEQALRVEVSSDSPGKVSGFVKVLAERILDLPAMELADVMVTVHGSGPPPVFETNRRAPKATAP